MITLYAAAAAAADEAAAVRRNLATMPRPWRSADYRPASPEAESYEGRANTGRLFRIDWKTFETALKYWDEKYDFVRLESMGANLEGDPMYKLTVTDPAVPPDEKFRIVIYAQHSGSERSGLHACLAALEFLMAPEAAKYRGKYEITVVPSGNVYGFFRAETPLNSKRIDPYAAGRGAHWNIGEIEPKKPEDTPELVAFCRLMDEIRPEILLDFHGVGRYVPGEIMTQYIGAAGSNHVLTPWADRLIEAMRRQANAGGTTVFRLDEEIQRLISVRESREAFPRRFRESGDYFYTDMYPYLKYHTLPIMFEIGYEKMAVEGLKGLLDFGLAPPADLAGGLPVDQLSTDWGGFIVRSWGATPGEKRRSRVDLWNRAEGIESGVIYPSTTYRIGRFACFGEQGVKALFGDRPRAFSTNLVKSGIFADRADTAQINWSAIRQFLKLGPEVNLAMGTVSGNLDKMPDTGAPQHGVSFAFDIQIAPAHKVEMLDVRLNGHSLKEDPRDGWQLVPYDGGHRLFVHVPPEKSAKLHLYFVTAAYDSDAKLAWGWRPEPEILKRAAAAPELKAPADTALFAADFENFRSDQPEFPVAGASWGYFKPGAVELGEGKSGQGIDIFYGSGGFVGWVSAARGLAPGQAGRLTFDFKLPKGGSMVCEVGESRKKAAVAWNVTQKRVYADTLENGGFKRIGTDVSLPEEIWIRAEVAMTNGGYALSFALPDGTVVAAGAYPRQEATRYNYAKFKPAMRGEGLSVSIDNVKLAAE